MDIYYYPRPFGGRDYQQREKKKRLTVSTIDLPITDQDGDGTTSYFSNIAPS